MRKECTAPGRFRLISRSQSIRNVVSKSIDAQPQCDALQDGLDCASKRRSRASSVSGDEPARSLKSSSKSRADDGFKGNSARRTTSAKVSCGLNLADSSFRTASASNSMVTTDMRPTCQTSAQYSIAEIYPWQGRPVIFLPVVRLADFLLHHRIPKPSLLSTFFVSGDNLGFPNLVFDLPRLAPGRRFHSK